MSNNEDPQERPAEIHQIINGLERYNPEAVGPLEAYLQQQCEQRYCDGNANRVLLKLYQLNPDRIKDEVITNILVKAMTTFPSPQFDLALHLLSPSSLASGSELAEAVSKLRALNAHLEGASFARFWATLDSDDLYADLTTDIDGFEETIRVRIAQLVSEAFREVQTVPVLGDWLGLEGKEAVEKFVVETCGWKVDGDKVVVPKNADNEAKKAEIREDVNVEMFARVIRRSWEEAA
ncbi:ARM repeat-containing protein [Cryphonectria parasitica EP155]|uniref:Eukaryotic translation initiation factor 3 subunit K n=1 Tax=Cryphonectria parasitica (strain ATCC 38755 / EP155) TaxID=660469 RepID=A0A9P4XZM6_CRYP1|nr:ARM repeat-containing protein [Cryphonectria parasitica EP155]KAF3763455.1 ARM repeat-containing protein [Cryphonectria parasitica EP155]